MDISPSSYLLSMLTKCRQALVCSAGLFCLVAGSAQAAVLVAVDDSYDIPPSQFLQVEPFGVIENDTLDDENAGESGATATLVTTMPCPADLPASVAGAWS